MRKRIGEYVGAGEPNGARTMARQTFVIHVHADGPSTLENLGTRERVAVSDLSTVGTQIERWLDESDGGGWRRASA
jgi:hypothetical protein